MPRVKMTPNFEKQQSHFRFNVYEPKSCNDAQEKIDSLRREIAALKEDRAELLKIQDQAEWVNVALVFAKGIKETSYSFLDLAVALASDTLPEPLAKKVKFTGNAGLGAIEMTETATEVWHGQSNMSDLAQTSAGATLRMADPKGVAGKGAKYLGNQALEMTGAMNAAQKGDSEKTRQGVQKASSNMAMNSVLYELDNTPGAEDVKSALETANAAKRYGDALEGALDSYLDEKVAIAERKVRIEQQMRKQIDGAVDKLQAALKEFDRCMVR